MKTAILITFDRSGSIDEAKALCDSAGYKVLHTIEQERLQHPKYGISAHVLEQLEDVASNLKPDVIVFDEILKPSQNYNIASKLHRNIIDREALILEIFESRATSSESQLQVKLAQLRYEMSRAKEKVRLAKMGEQPGFLGIGKFEVDVYYNDIKHRMITVKSKLEKSKKQRELHRQARKRQGFKIISLAGYTSAGKTTLFNKLTGENKEKSAELFTTLSTTTRRVTINQEAHLISDTIGFISKLPAYMIEAFKSTLEELIFTDMILVVIDISDSVFELKKKFRSCDKTFNDLGVERDKMIFVLNKSDLLTTDRILEKIKYLDLEDSKKLIHVSAASGKNISELKELISKILRQKSNTIIKKNYLKKEFEKIYGN